MFSKYRYCYMRSVLVDSEDKTRAFSLILSNESFTRISVYNTDLKGLVHLNTLDTLIKDFSIENNYLKCSEVPRVPLTANDINSFGEIIEIEDDFVIFSDFVRYGSDNSFYIIPEEIINEEHHLGNSLTPFNHIEFSKSTMTVYARVFNDNQIKNQMLIVMNEQNLEIVPFYFITDIEHEIDPLFREYVSFLHTIVINNITYNLYKFNNMPIYPTMTLKVNSLINKAMTMSIKQQSLIGIIKECKLFLREMLGHTTENKQYEWVGGSNSYKSKYGIYFKSSLQRISKEGCVDILNSYFSILEKCQGDSMLVCNTIEAEESMHLRKLALYTIHNLMTSDSDFTQVLLNCDEVISELNNARIHCETYLYKVRLFSYFTGNRLVPRANPVITGSDEEAYTIVDQKLLYGME